MLEIRTGKEQKAMEKVLLQSPIKYEQEGACSLYWSPGVAPLGAEPMVVGPERKRKREVKSSRVVRRRGGGIRSSKLREQGKKWVDIPDGYVENPSCPSSSEFVVAEVVFWNLL